MRREVETHKNHVEALEMDKRRVEGVIRQTMMERQALDKSLGTMEKENTELYRNCSILQNQLSQLEHENNSRSTEINNRTRIKLETEINKLNQEKRQLEKLINQREQNYAQKEKVLDGQIRDLQHQLDAEKRRRRQIPSPNLPGPSTPSISSEHHYAAIRRTTVRRRSVDLTRSQRAPFRP
uniref:Uncharacterized protein n=1 Tax=Ditylenchus dipsaci TaxID=166011 RepID=A0A915EFI6_9BILA